MAFMPWRAARSATVSGFSGKKRSRRADVEPLGKESRGGDAAHRFVEPRELFLRRLTISFVGGEKMRHHAFKPERRTGTEAREYGGEAAGACALAAHSGVDFEMDGQRVRLRSSGACGGEQLVELPRLPGDGRQLELNGGRGLAGKDAADDKHASIGAQGASDNAFFHAGDAEPLCAGTHDGWSAESERVTVRVGFDDGQQFSVRRSEAGKKTEVRFESAGANLNPGGTCCHGGRQRSVYGIGGKTMSRCNSTVRGLVSRSTLIPDKSS